MILQPFPNTLYPYYIYPKTKENEFPHLCPQQQFYECNICRIIEQTMMDKGALNFRFVSCNAFGFHQIFMQFRKLLTRVIWTIFQYVLSKLYSQSTLVLRLIVIMMLKTNKQLLSAMKDAATSSTILKPCCCHPSIVWYI